MALTQKAFDSLPDIVDPSTREAWGDCVLAMVDEFSLTDTQYAQIEGRYETIGAIFSAPHDPRLRGCTFFTQGSFMSRTVIKPPSDGEIDVDAVVWCPSDHELDSAELYEAVFDELNQRVRTSRGLERKNRCVRVLYADEAPTFHLDVTPARNAFGNREADGVGKLVVHDIKAFQASGNGWKPSAPKAFADWLEEKSLLRVRLRKAFESASMDMAEGKVEPLPTKEELDQFDPLRAAIKLFKFHRAQYFSGRANAKFQPISVLLTTLAAKAYQRVAQRSFHQSLTPIEAITAIVDELPKGFDLPSDSEPHRLCNPVYETENFAERWNDPQDGEKRVSAFRDWHQQLSRDIRLGQKAFGSDKEFINEAAEAFGTHGAKALLGRIITEKFKSGAAVPGLSETAAAALAHNGALETVFGIGSSKPKQEPEGLGQLG